MATHSSNLGWRIPWTEEPGGLQSMGSQRVGHDWTTKRSIPQTAKGRRKSEDSAWPLESTRAIPQQNVQPVKPWMMDA